MAKNVKFLSVISGAATGFVNGVFGGGGGMLVVPTLSGLLKKEQKKAQATAIFIILPVSIVSTIVYSSFGSVDSSVLFPTALGVIIGGIIGAKFLKKAQNGFLSTVFYLSMLVVGLKMVF